MSCGYACASLPLALTSRLLFLRAALSVARGVLAFVLLVSEQPLGGFFSRSAVALTCCLASYTRCVSDSSRCADVRPWVDVCLWLQSSEFSYALFWRVWCAAVAACVCGLIPCYLGIFIPIGPCWTTRFLPCCGRSWRFSIPGCSEPTDV